MTYNIFSFKPESPKAAKLGLDVPLWSCTWRFTLPCRLSLLFMYSLGSLLRAANLSKSALLVLQAHSAPPALLSLELAVPDLANLNIHTEDLRLSWGPNWKFIVPRQTHGDTSC